MSDNVCLCGSAAGYPHDPKCPYPMYRDDPKWELKGENEMKPKYPKVVVKLVGEDGNAFAVLGAVTKALRAAGVAKPKCDEFFEEATSGNYDHLLQVVMRWVEVR